MHEKKLTKVKALIASLPISLAALLPTALVKGFLKGAILIDDRINLITTQKESKKQK